MQQYRILCISGKKNVHSSYLYFSRNKWRKGEDFSSRHINHQAHDSEIQVVQAVGTGGHPGANPQLESLKVWACHSTATGHRGSDYLRSSIRNMSARGEGH